MKCINLPQTQRGLPLSFPHSVLSLSLYIYIYKRISPPPKASTEGLFREGALFLSSNYPCREYHLPIEKDLPSFLIAHPDYSFLIAHLKKKAPKLPYQLSLRSP